MTSDLTKVRQILLNLVSNACKFTQNGTVTLKARRDGEQLRFEVADTGIGIPPDKLENLFEPFVQADVSTTRRYGGTGLGLTISKAVLRAARRLHTRRERESKAAPPSSCVCPWCRAPARRCTRKGPIAPRVPAIDCRYGFWKLMFGRVVVRCLVAGLLLGLPLSVAARDTDR